MAKMGSVKPKDVKRDREEREKRKGGSFLRFHSFKTGTSFIKMLPPSINMMVPWVQHRRHFGLGKNQKSVGPCTETGKDCFSCKQVRKDLNAQKVKVRKLAERRKVSITNAFQMVDVTPLYTKTKKKGKTKFTPDNPPSECWGQIKLDEDGDPVKSKCQKCLWNESCKEGVTIGGLSGQRIDEISSYFEGDKLDITDLIEGRNIKIVKKGKTFGNTSYKVDASSKYNWEIPSSMQDAIKKRFQDLTEILKPGTPQETEDAWKGRTESDDMPECLGEFNPKKKKCKECEFADICSEEESIDDELSSNDNDDDKKGKKKKSKKGKEKEGNDDNNDNDNNDNDNNDDNNDNDDNDNDNDDNDDDKKKEEGNDNNNDNDNDNNNNNNNDDDDDNDDDDNNNNDDKKKDDSNEKDDPLEDMDKKQLKKFIKKNNLKVRVKDDMNEKKIRKLIHEELDNVSKKQKAKEIKNKLKEKAKKK